MIETSTGPIGCQLFLIGGPTFLIGSATFYVVADTECFGNAALLIDITIIYIGGSTQGSYRLYALLETGNERGSRTLHAVL